MYPVSSLVQQCQLVYYVCTTYYTRISLFIDNCELHSPIDSSRNNCQLLLGGSFIALLFTARARALFIDVEAICKWNNAKIIIAQTVERGRGCNPKLNIAR